jgi:hypothetical protein
VPARLAGAGLVDRLAAGVDEDRRRPAGCVTIFRSEPPAVMWGNPVSQPSELARDDWRDHMLDNVAVVPGVLQGPFHPGPLGVRPC